MAAETGPPTREPRPGWGGVSGTLSANFSDASFCEGSVEATHRRAGGSPGIRAARDCYDAIERGALSGALNSRIADAELATAKAVVSSPKTAPCAGSRDRRPPSASAAAAEWG